MEEYKFIYIKKAFDSVNHQILLEKLCNCGIKGARLTIGSKVSLLIEKNVLKLTQITVQWVIKI